MRKYLYWFPLCLFMLAACQHKKHFAVIDKWIDYRKAYNFYGRQNDSAFYYFNKLTRSSKDSQQVAIAYSVMAGIQSDAGDYFGAQENLTLSLKFLNHYNPKNLYSLAMTYNELGMVSFNQKHYDEAIKLYKEGLKFSVDSASRSIIMCNEANTFQQQAEYEPAIRLYSEAAILVKNNPLDRARILTNMTTARWRQNKQYNAAPELLGALNIRIKGRDIKGQNSSYARLADFYEKYNRDSALHYAKKNMQTALQTQNPDDRLEVLSRLIRLEKPQNIQGYFTQYQQLNDSLQTARNAAKNQFALIRYAAEKTEADNLKLQRDNDQKKYLIVKQNIIMYSSLAVFIAFTIGASYWYRKRRQQAIQDSQLRLSKKVHDVVANGLYQMMQEIDNGDEFEKEPIVDRLNMLYERSRDISHDEIMIKKDDFPEKIKRMIMAFASPETNIAIVGNEDNLWLATNEPVKNELEYILQELMVNMKKHSKATSVAIKFELEGKRLIITYTDNGIGLPANIKYGHGLQNTGNRIKVLGGSVNFDNNLNKGIRIRLNVPVA